MTAVRSHTVLLVVLPLLVGTIACGSGVRPGAGPLLRIPEAPPRVVTALPLPEAEPIDTAATPVPPDQPQPDAESAETPLVAEQTPTAPEPDDTVIDTAADVDDDQSPDDTRIREPLTAGPDQDVDPDMVVSTLSETVALLDAIDRSTLDSAARAQYDTARRFLDQAASALAVGSVVFAQYLGQKASALLQGL